ncbi:Snf7-domain-containing protein [Mycena pura]|uniref:Snf7-domain-containing protein n=1 Tax=Mycena pura TaxID=153505 RepID=A0AAD6YJN4_9AGAR|nr:Snf7-domain-containing protein [Mycena pura]
MMQTPSKAPASPALLALPPYATTSTSRLQSIYADISHQKHSNPANYNANVEWWRKTLEAIARSGIQQHGSNLVLNADSGLMDLLRVPGAGKPLALPTAVAELRAQKKIFTRSEFLSCKESVYDAGWLPGRIAAYVVGKPLWWALEQLGVVGEDSFIYNTSVTSKNPAWWGEYVILPLVEAAADIVLAKQADKLGGPSDALYSFDAFKKTFSDVFSGGADTLSDVDATILLRFLQRDRRAVIVDKEVIKFVDPRSASALRCITAVDRSILELKEAVHHLHVQVAKIQQKIDQCTQKATAALQQSHKPLALTYLRSRKQLEDLLRKRLGSLETLEGTQLSVETAAGDIEILKSYESSTATLRSILAHPSLQKESIDKTLDAMAEANEDAKEVDEAIRSGTDVTFDEAELEEELRILALEAENEKVDETQAKLAREELQTPEGRPVSERAAPSAVLLS